jgi:hypothetical protein
LSNDDGFSSGISEVRFIFAVDFSGLDTARPTAKNEVEELPPPGDFRRDNAWR